MVAFITGSHRNHVQNQAPVHESRRLPPVNQFGWASLMGHYEPQTVTELASVLEDICRGLENEDGQSVSPDLKAALAKRMLNLFDNGIKEPDRLRIEVMADRLWASAKREPLS
jgi:hypothetical protein